MGSSALPITSDNIVTIKWQGHSDILAEGLSNFYHNQYLVDTDVTVSGESIKVHQLILSLFLPTFKDSVDNVDGHLDGLNLDCVANSIEDVRALVEFIYKGSVSVAKDRLGHLGRLADCLQFEVLSKVIGQLCQVETVQTGETTDLVADASISYLENLEIKREPHDDVESTLTIDVPDSSKHEEVIDENYELTSATSCNIDQGESISDHHERCTMCGVNFELSESNVGHDFTNNKDSMCRVCIDQRKMSNIRQSPLDIQLSEPGKATSHSREYGCAFCKTFNTVERVAWTDHMSQIHGFMHSPSVNVAIAGRQIASTLVSFDYTCPVCDFRFPTMERRDRHLRWMHTPVKRKRLSD